MPNIRTALVNTTGIILASSNGKTAIVTFSQILSHYTGSGNDKAATQLWIGQQLETALGTDQVAAAQVTTDFDIATGIPTACTITG